MQTKEYHSKRNKKYRENNKETIRTRMREYYANNRNKYMDRNLRKRYNITLEQYQSMLQDQNNVCAICRKAESRIHKNGTVFQLAVDHDHLTGKIRGLLCHNCNLFLGIVQDNPQTAREFSITFKKAADYLEDQVDRCSSYG